MERMEFIITSFLQLQIPDLPPMPFPQEQHLEEISKLLWKGEIGTFWSTNMCLA